MNNLFTCQEVAERYRVEVLTVWNWIRKKRLPAIKIGRDYRVREEDLRCFEEAGRTIQKK